ncbi:MAG TPA: 16S rRNA (adenine(1518)-N(6)/adenine(1519)-N(6))-dimethyltransferase RsmA [Thermoanaerobaculia bacterium]|nr:16S rRNA (adenine(1518)-N(6)/adenine(1519)-N(6))-dimethyltransferase RsmA [Thermoanaerobaculia bacterium]
MPRPPLQKRLGQHHLVSGALCSPLVGFLRPAGERVVEIGPGGGVLTGELLAAGAARVVGWEVDPAWAAELGRRFAGERRLAVVVADALDLDWPALAEEGPTLAAGNLPYNVATPILERLLPHHAAVPRAAFLVQKEVGEKLVARPGEPEYGSLSVLVAAYAEARLLGTVPRGAFRPPPKVDGAFVGLALRPPPLPAAEMPAFLATVRAAFAKRRKTLRNSLAAAWGRDDAERALAAFLPAHGLPPTARAERLGVAELVELHRARFASGAPNG